MPWVLLSGLIQLAAAGALLAGVTQTGALGFIGLRQALDPRGAEPLIAGRGAGALVVGGLYRRVRHPLYTCGLVILWLTPVMTCNLLALAAGLTGYILIGIPFEERKLLAEFGEAYAEYRKRTPALVPRIRGSHHGTLKGAGDTEGTEKKS
jgi:protein-S-isoprenylcysteine O-methyltransferase Ste14